MKLLLVIFILGAVKAPAFFERGLSAAAGTNPKGASVNASLAYNQLLWDGRVHGDESQFWKYGYLRPKTYYESSFYINTLGAELQIYPISIFGGSVGTSYADRTVKSLDLYECDQVDCKGQVSKTFYNLNLNLGYQSWVMVLFYQNTQLEASSEVPALVEYSSMLLIPKKSSSLDTKVVFLGYKLTEQITAALYGTHYQIESKKSEGQYLVVSYKYDDYSWIVGTGAFGSDYNEKTFAAFVKVSWLFDPTLSLID